MTVDVPGDAAGVQRREVLQLMLAGAASVPVSAALAAQSSGTPGAAPSAPARPRVAMLVYPRMVLLDLVGPMTALNIAQCEILLVGKSREPCSTDVGVPISPTVTFADCPNDLDVLFVPGGIVGTTACMNDPEVLAFLADRGARARYVTAVCTGTLVLAAAGLLRGYKAATHWAVMDLLPLMGAEPVEERVVEDRNRMTGGGVTAGIDFGLTLVARLRDEATARRTQLIIEYAPAPPFDAGTPKRAGVELVRQVRESRTQVDGAARKAAEAAAMRLGVTRVG